MLPEGLKEAIMAHLPWKKVILIAAGLVVLAAIAFWSQTGSAGQTVTVYKAPT